MTQSKKPVLSFDEWLVTATSWSEHDCYEAGQQSRQEEVNEIISENHHLQTKIYDLELKLKSNDHSAREVINAMSMHCNYYLKGNDEWQRKYDAMYNAFVFADDARKEWYESFMRSTGKSAELHKKIDEALEKCYTGIRKQGGDYYLELVEGVLKGKEDEK